jgi:hypothetical protein
MGDIFVSAKNEICVVPDNLQVPGNERAGGKIGRACVGRSKNFFFC